MFFGTAGVINHNNKIPDPQHPLLMKGFNQTHMCLIIFLFLLFARFLIIAYEMAKSKMATNDADDNDVLDKDVEENIDFYWRSLEGTDQKNLYTDEVYKRNKFGIKGLTDEALEILRTTDRRVKVKPE